MGIQYVLRLGETHMVLRRTPLCLRSVQGTYAGLQRDLRFIAPALAMSLVIGSRYLFFALAPAILMAGLGFSPLPLALFSHWHHARTNLPQGTKPLIHRELPTSTSCTPLGHLS